MPEYMSHFEKSPLLAKLTIKEKKEYLNGFGRIFPNVLCSVRLGIVPITKHLIEVLSVSPNVQRSVKLRDSTSNLLLTPLIIALKERDGNMLKYLLTVEGIDVNALIDTRAEIKLVHFAAVYSDAACCALLLQHCKMDVHARDKKGRTALELMVYLPRHVPEVVKKFQLMLDFGNDSELYSHNNIQNNFNHPIFLNRHRRDLGMMRAENSARNGSFRLRRNLASSINNQMRANNDVMARNNNDDGHMENNDWEEELIRQEFWYGLREMVYLNRFTTESEKFQLLGIIGAASA
eukprot:CAMPEP_0184870430 /NCGR_PEP_ID=MMETSP0580-20130426/37418_1 /TAXON_ID=1118495 /ORGANISM="Dactyliosolen fragilissimus" /LENGTH=291 /DNA_ID=CAMNT_0027372481 /DNA_START=577 /DNA_END=1452 /DNA_ORIENTATION=-